MKVLCACEESQVVCKEFRLIGHEAYSCDIISCSGNHPEWHIKDDVRNIINDDWDLIIAHPPCTYLSNAAARWLYKGGVLNFERYIKGLEAKEFFMLFYNNKCKRICIENPLQSKIFNMPEPTQIIQPYMFGEPWSKKTYLWLKGLPNLIETNIVKDYKPYVSSGKYSYTHDDKYKGYSRKGGAAKVRAKTFEGIAAAMANQWGGIL